MTEQATNPQPASNGWSFRRKLLIWGGVTAVVLLIALALGSWYYIRSGRLNERVAREIEAALQEYGLRAEIGGFELAGLRTVTLRQLKFYNQQTGQLIATLDRAVLSLKILEPYALRLSREIVLERLELQQLEAWVTINAQGQSNFVGLRQPPPSASRRITFDYANLIGELQNSKFHYDDQVRNIRGELNDLHGTVRPLSDNGVAAARIELAAVTGEVSYEGRQETIDQLEFTGRVTQSGAEIEKLLLRSPLTEMNVTGRLDDWQQLNYQFKVKGQANLERVAHLFTPDTALQGTAQIDGNIEGTGPEYRFSGQASAAEFVAAELRVRGARDDALTVKPENESLLITTQQVSAQAVSGSGFNLSNVVARDIRAELQDGVVEIKAAQARAARAQTANQRTPAALSDITLGNIGATFSENRLTARATAQISGASFDKIKLGKTTGQLTVNQSTVSFDQFTAALFGGSVSGNLKLQTEGRAASQLQAEFRNIKTDELVSSLSLGEIPLAGTVDGRANVTWPGLEATLLSGNINTRFSGATNVETGAIPLNGEATVRAERGAFNFDPLQLRTDVTTLTANGTLTQKGNSNLAFTLNSTRAEELQTIAYSLAPLQEMLNEYEPILAGNFNFAGTITGALSDPTVAGELNAASIGLNNEMLGSLTGRLLFAPTEIRFEEAALTANNGGTIKLNYAAPRAENAVSGHLDATLERIRIEDVVKAGGFSLNQKLLVGEVTGTANLTGLPAAPEGRASFNLQNGTIAGQPAEAASAEVVFDTQNARIEKLEARLPQGHLQATGNINLKTKDFTTSGRADQVNLARLGEALELKDINLTGTVNATFEASGKYDNLDDLNLQLNAQGSQVTINGRETGELKLVARTSPGGRIEAELTSSITGQPQLVTGSIELRQPGRPIEVRTELNNYNLGPLLSIFAPGAASNVAGNVTGTLQISGPLFDAQGNAALEKLRGSLLVNDIALEIAGNKLNIATPLTVALDNAQLTLEPTRITGQGTDLQLGGTLGLRENTGLNFTLKGNIELGSFNQPDSNVVTDGAVAIDLRLTGTTSNPQLAGGATLNNIALSLLDPSFAIEQGNGRITFADNRVTLDNFTALANDGTLAINGTATLDGMRPAEWKVEATATDVLVLYAGARATANATLSLNGTPNSQILSGTVNIPLAEYTANFGIDGAFGSGGSINFGDFGGGISSSSAASANSFFPPIFLNVRVEAIDALLVRNEQVNTTASALLTVAGTVSEPEVRGRISLEGGTIKFRNQRYDITTGMIELPGGFGSEPVLNLLAEGDVGGYHVYAGFTGPIDNLEVTLRSEPELARAEILSLMTTGTTETGTLNSSDIVRSGVGTAASLLAEEFISKPVQSETEKLLGLNLFQIDPVLRPNANPAARLTIGRQLTRGLSFSYSTNLASEQDQTVLMEYNLTSRFSALAAFTQGGSSTRQGTNDNDFLIEIRGRKRFALGVDRTSTGIATNRPTLNIARPEPRKRMPVTVNLNKPDFVKISEDKRDELLPIIKEGYSRALTRLGERNLTNYLQEQGYFFAEVETRCEPANCTGPDLRVYYDVMPGQRYDLENIRLIGTDELSLSDVQGQLQSQESSLLGKIPYLKTLPLIGGSARGITSNDRLRNDQEVIRRQMVDLGFRSARVEKRLGVSPENDKLVVIFDVTEGPRSTIAEINARGNTILTLNEVQQTLPLQSGDEFSPTTIRTGAQRIREEYGRRGFLDAKATAVITDMPNNRVQLTYEIEEGVRSIVQEVAITGQTMTQEDSIRRFIDFKPGDVLTPQSLQRTRRDLYATGAFREADIKTEAIPNQEETARRVTVNVTEANPLLLVYGLGYSTDEGPRALTQFTHTNLFGRVNSGTLRLRGSRREQLVQLQFTDLRPFASKWATTFSAFYNRNADLRTFIRNQVNNQDQADKTAGRSFGINRLAAFIQTERKLNERTSLRFRYNFERAKLFNLENIPIVEVTRNERAIRLGMISAGFSRDTRDSAINPTRGQLLSADHSLAAGIFGGNESFNKFFGNYQRYHTLSESVPLLKNSVLAFSARIGLAASFQRTDRDGDGVITQAERSLPISERFFAGGATTLRGFRFEEAGPQGILEPRNANELPTLVPLGGDALAVFNFELRYPLTRQLRLVPFYDLGNVFRHVRDINFSRMTNTVGLGLRFNTPIGPVGVDYGYLLDPPAFVTASGGVLRQPRGVIHIRFGQSF
jgi:outer membrane protein assembly complex protein YaeT